MYIPELNFLSQLNHTTIALAGAAGPAGLPFGKMASPTTCAVLTLLLLLHPFQLGALTIGSVRSVLAELVEEGVLSHRQANTVYLRVNRRTVEPSAEKMLTVSVEELGGPAVRNSPCLADKTSLPSPRK